MPLVLVPGREKRAIQSIYAFPNKPVGLIASTRINGTKIVK
jgi:hypothetical protein